MKVYKYKDLIIPETKVQKRLKQLGISMEDLIEVSKSPPTLGDFNFPYTYRINVNTVLCAPTEEGLKHLKVLYGIS